MKCSVFIVFNSSVLLTKWEWSLTHNQHWKNFLNSKYETHYIVEKQNHRNVLHAAT